MTEPRERRDPENRDLERDVERRDVENRDVERRDVENRDVDRRDVEQRAAEHRDPEQREHGRHEHRDGEHHEHHHGIEGLEETLAERPDLAAILFDLRSVIGLLFVVYGIVLTILGIIGESPEDLAKSGGLALNLWVGIVMLVAGIVFFVWAFSKPPTAPDPEEMAHYEEGGPMHMGH